MSIYFSVNLNLIIKDLSIDIGALTSARSKLLVYILMLTSFPLKGIPAEIVDFGKLFGTIGK